MKERASVEPEIGPERSAVTPAMPTRGDLLSARSYVSKYRAFTAFLVAAGIGVVVFHISRTKNDELVGRASKMLASGYTPTFGEVHRIGQITIVKVEAGVVIAEGNNILLARSFK
jgi:hypothetical protein